MATVSDLGDLLDGLFGGKKSQEKAAKEAHKKEIARQQQMRREQQERTAFATAPGQGIQDAASISLGFDDEDEDDLFDISGTGLVI